MTKRECILLGMLIGVAGLSLCMFAGQYLGDLTRRARCAVCSHMEVGPDLPLFIDLAAGVTEVLDFSSREDGGWTDGYLVMESEEETGITVLNPAAGADFDAVCDTGRFCDTHARQLAKEGIPYGVLFGGPDGFTFARAKTDEAYRHGAYYMDATMEGGSLYIYVLRGEE